MVACFIKVDLDEKSIEVKASSLFHSFTTSYLIIQNEVSSDESYLLKPNILIEMRSP